MIKTLLFDFGDVFLTLDKPATARKLQELGLTFLSEEMLKQNKLYEIGEISSEEFISFYKKQLPETTSEKLEKAWNAILVELPEKRLRFLQQLAAEKKYQLILLSNTNELHINWVKENMESFEDFRNCFYAFYLSHEINFRKPNVDIYDFIVEKHQLKPQEILFIDDTKENTEAAKALGFHTWNINPQTEDVVDLFTKNAHLF
jgi:putative hydrolase of the HAD superfamily